MKLYVNQCTEECGALFTVTDEDGGMCYTVQGGLQVLGGKLCVVDADGQPAACIRRVGLPSVSTYEISAGGKSRLLVVQNLASRSAPFRMRGLGWRFRGNVRAKSFDVMDVDRTIVMTHGLCWNAQQNSYAVEITREADIPVCLCLAVIVDLAAADGMGAAQPVAQH